MQKIFLIDDFFAKMWRLSLLLKKSFATAGKWFYTI